MTPLEELTRVLYPPKECSYCPNPEADQKLRELMGRPLPSSYREFLARFGPGYIGKRQNDLNFLTVYDPWTILRQNHRIFELRGYASNRTESSDSHWSLPGGLLMWGYSCDGHEYYWCMDGEPDSWSILVQPRHTETTEVFNLDLPSFLLAVIQGDIDPIGVPSAIKPGEERPVWVQWPMQFPKRVDWALS